MYLQDFYKCHALTLSSIFFLIFETVSILKTIGISSTFNFTCQESINFSRNSFLYVRKISIRWLFPYLPNILRSRTATYSEVVYFITVSVGFSFGQAIIKLVICNTFCISGYFLAFVDNFSILADLWFVFYFLSPHQPTSIFPPFDVLLVRCFELSR